MAAQLKPRLAFFFPSLAGGGVQRSLLLLAQGMLAEGLAVDLVVGTAQGAMGDQVPPGAELVNLGVPHLRRGLGPLVRYLRQARPAALLAAQTHANVLALWARRLANVPLRLVVSEHNHMTSVVRSSRGLDRLRPLAARLFYPWADRVVAVSQGVADDLSERAGLPPGRIKVIYNPLIPPGLAAHLQAPCPHPWLEDGGSPVLLAAGRLVPQKDHPCLLRAMACLRERCELRLVICGEGPLRSELETLARQLGLQDWVAFPGYIPNLYACLGRASVFVLSSAWEGFPSVLVEALACGVPVVATDCPSGPAEILAGGRHGRLVPVGDAPALAEAILASLNEPADREEARRWAGQFTLERAVQAYLPLFLGPQG